MQPWQIILIIVGAIIITNVIRIMIKSKTHHFVCPNCGNSFKASFVRIFFTAHFFGGKCEEKCPKCGQSHLMKAIRDEK